LGTNVGPHALWGSGLLETLSVTGRFILSDPDVVPTEDCPDDAIEVLADALDQYPDRVKAGLGLRIDDLPDHYPRKAEVLAWERQYWETELAPELYDANVDTTFALYRPGLPFAYGPSARTGPPYLARHVPWYTDPARIAADEKFYYERAAGVTHWPLQLPSPDRKDYVPGDEGQVTLTILEATYGKGDGVVDVTAQLQELVRTGCSLFTVSNRLFGDPCPNQLKILRFTYQLPGDDRQHTHEVREHQVVSLRERVW